MLVLEMVPEGSWKRVRAAWRDFFKWAVAEGIRPDNPVDRLPKLRPTAPPVYDDLWRQDELDLLVAATRRMDMPLIQKLRVLTMIESGCRAAELRGMQLGDFDLYRKAVTVLGKGNKRRRIPISGELVNTVDEHLLTEYPMIERLPTLTDYLWFPVHKMGDRILTMKPEKMLGYSNFWAWWKKVESEAGVRHRKPHMMRHTFATDVLDATEGNLYAVQALLGHSSTRVTETYLHSSRTHMQAAVEALGEYRKRAPAKTSLSTMPKTPANAPKKATSGFEPLYEALQASA